MNSLTRIPVPEKTSIKCPYCQSSYIKKEGKRKSKFQILQKYFCKDCSKNFADKKLEHKSYPSKIVLNAISYYNLGYTQTETSTLISQKYKVKVPQRTISEWLNQYKEICTFNKLRDKAIKLYNPKDIIFKKSLQHQQVYLFQYHKAKLYLLFNDVQYNNQFKSNSKFYEPIKNYLEKIPTEQFPHHIFKSFEAKVKEGIIKLRNPDFIDKVSDDKANEQRSSQLKLKTLPFIKLQKNNLANKLAKLALTLAKTNKERHKSIQDFMLINDSSTVAVEVPVYLTKYDVNYFKNKFILNLEEYQTPITGHIDVLQVRNGLVHILDYKPDLYLKQVQEQAIKQLTIYALALASRTKLALTDLKCAFFDENSYYEFFPFHTVNPRI